MKEILGIHGGEPTRKNYLPYGKQWIDEGDIQKVIDILGSDYLTTGPKIKEFEEKIANHVGAKYAVAVSNGTAALHGACFAAGIRRGDEVITTPMTFAASANCILYQGARPIFADINPKTYNIDVEDIKRKITSRTKAIIPVDFTGQPADLDPILKLAQNYGLMVIEDGAHALGARYKGKKVGNISPMTTFSFHPVKHITTGEGGMITTNEEELYKRLLLFRSHGISREEDLLQDKNQGNWYYEQLALGYNYRITDIQCALGVSQLERLDGFIAKRKALAEAYNEALENMEGLILPYQADFSESSWHLYVIQLELGSFKVGRKEIFEALQGENIGVNVHYIPVYYHPYYQELGYKKGLCPKAEELYEGIISLPLFPKMDKEEVLDVTKAVKKVLNYYRK
ncbi:MAG: UDP-4-amino-4,6-dideoxy-N-acetyl-beta-L-altrosamine transaminase [Thermotaleaceae bacterium]